MASTVSGLGQLGEQSLEVIKHLNSAQLQLQNMDSHQLVLLGNVIVSEAMVTVVSMMKGWFGTCFKRCFL